MVLRVNLESFADSVKRLLPDADVFVARRALGVLATAADPAKRLLVVSSARLSPTEVRRKLEKDGLKVAEGEWSMGDEGLETPGEQMSVHVAAVSYKSREDMPGLWVDAFDGDRTPAEVLRAMYDEFLETGELGELTMEEFLKLANPNVVILSPEELVRFAERKRPC